MANSVPFEQKTQFRTDEQAGTYSDALKTAYKAPNNETLTGYTGLESFQNSLPRGNAPGALANQVAQDLTTEQDNVPSVGAKRAYPNL